MFRELAQITAGSPLQFLLVTDRGCGAEAAADAVSAARVRIEEPDRVRFSERAAEALADAGAVSCCLFFARLVDPALFERLPTYNVHPSVLPAYRGFRAVERARSDGATLLGATLHRVTAEADAGPIVAQIATGADPAWPIERWRKMSFLQKVHLALVWAQGELSAAPSPPGLNASPSLTHKAWAEAFAALQAREGVEVARHLPES